MHDPLRIPGVLDAVRRAWEGQPDLSLPTLFGILANRGVGWGATDDDLLRELAVMERSRPGELPLTGGHVTARYLITTTDPGFVVTVDPWQVIVRRPGATAQPGVWRYATLRAVVVGGPLVVTSADGVDHRLGVVDSIVLLDATPSPSVPSLSGLQRRDVGDSVHLIRFKDGDSLVLSRSLEFFRVDRRSVERETGAWESLPVCAPGEALVVQPPGGGPVRDFAEVRDILLMEAAPALD